MPPIISVERSDREPKPFVRYEIPNVPGAKHNRNVLHNNRGRGCSMRDRRSRLKRNLGILRSHILDMEHSRGTASSNRVHIRNRTVRTRRHILHRRSRTI